MPPNNDYLRILLSWAIECLKITARIPSGKKGLSSLPNSLETFQSKNQLSRQRKENHAPRTPVFGSGIHIPENQIPRLTYVPYIDRKSSGKSALSGSNDSIYSRLLGSEYDTRLLSLSSPGGGGKKIPNCSFKSHSQGHPSATKLFLQGSRGDGGGCGFPPHALSPAALERCQVRTHRETLEPPISSAMSSQPAQGQQTTPATLLGTALHTSSSQTNQKLLQPPHPQRNCLFLSNSQLL